MLDGASCVQNMYHVDFILFHIFRNTHDLIAVGFPTIPNLWNPLPLVPLPLTRVFQVLKSVASDCLFGVLTVILQSLPAIDYEKGRNETQEILDIADDLVAIFEQFLDIDDSDMFFWGGFFGGIYRLRFAVCCSKMCGSSISKQRQPDRDDIWSSASSAGWDVDALVRTTRLYRRMLQPIAGEKCQLKVYVYPPPKLKLGDYSVIRRYWSQICLKEALEWLHLENWNSFWLLPGIWFLQQLGITLNNYHSPQRLRSSAPRSLLQTEAGYFGAMSAGMPLQ